MGANVRSKLLLGAAAVAALALVVVLLGDAFRGEEADAERAGDGAGETVGEEETAAVRAPRPDLARAGGDDADHPPFPEVAPAGGTDDEHPVDLAHLRALIPDNTYWRLGAPTDDPQDLKMRAEDKQRWNELYGKVLSGTGTEEEVRRYFEHRRQVSEDYIEFAKLLLDEYGERLPEQERGLYELSIKMHTTRLAELPRQIEDALARKQEQDRRREEWRRSQEQ